MKRYIDAEKLIAEIERRIENWTIRGEHSPAGQGRDTCESRVTELSDLLSFITSLQKEHPSLPSNLDEAAEKYSENILANNEDLQDAIEDAFKDGAEWMAGQGWTLDGEVKDQPTGGDDFEIYLDYDRDKMEDILDEICDHVNANYPDDDNRYKVIIQIRKK